LREPNDYVQLRTETYVRTLELQNCHGIYDGNNHTQRPSPEI